MSLVADSVEKVGMLTGSKIFLASWARSFKADAGDLIMCNVVILNGIRFDRRVRCHLDSFTVCLSLGLFNRIGPKPKYN